jgi:CMP-N,N'-diacetyllegionaminic acid synthase
VRKRLAGRGVIALIPARGGSKGLPGKNLADLGGFPLIALSVVAGLEARSIDRVIVTTDSEEIAEVARNHGAETPFLRPAELSDDSSLDVDYIRHAIDWLKTNEGAAPEFVVQLRPTTPLREPERVDEGVSALRARPDATGLRSVHLLAEPPQKMLGLDGGLLTGLFPDDPRPEYFNLPRQAFAPAYWPNGYVDVVRVLTVEQGDGALYGSRVLGFVTPPVVEIDGPDDLDYVRYQAERAGNPLLDLLRARAAGG